MFFTVYVIFFNDNASQSSFRETCKIEREAKLRTDSIWSEFFLSLSLFQHECESVFICLTLSDIVRTNYITIASVIVNVPLYLLLQ